MALRFFAALGAAISLPITSGEYYFCAFRCPFIVKILAFNGVIYAIKFNILA
jgi:hypothetical protein